MTAPRHLEPLAPPKEEHARVPREYGAPPERGELRPWSEIADRLDKATVYWMVTLGPDAQPRARPVDGLFVEGRLYVGGSPETRWVRDVQQHGKVTVHLEDGWDVVILEGEAEILPGVAPELGEKLAAASNAKYPQYGVQTAASYAGPGPIVIHPRIGLAWKSFPKDLTRYRFGGA